MRLVQPLYQRNGDLYAVMLSPQAWALVQDVVRPVLEKQAAAEAPEPKEPIRDWETLKEYWDFKYPVEQEVHCDHCGCETVDWEQDEPRKFRLKAANMGGQVSFLCLNCSSRVIKRHFKDHISFECRPCTEK
jgi:hypothetical protein